MDKLTKDQRDEYATSFAALALYDGGVSFDGKLDVICWEEGCGPLII